jgi:cytochrome b561
MSALIERYSRQAVILHWLIGVLIIANVIVAFGHELLPEDMHRSAIDLHKSIGMTVLGLAIMRILWRLTHRPPAMPATYKTWARHLSHSVHWLLYILMFALPITGWLHDSAWKMAPQVKMYWFGLFEVPRINWVMNMEPAAKEAFHDVMGERHSILGFILIGLFVLHVAGALKHQFMDKEAELQRMWR